MKKTFLILCLCLPFMGAGWLPAQQFERTYSNFDTIFYRSFPLDLVTDHDHSLLLWGSTGDYGQEDFWAMRIDETGDTLWSRTYRTSGWDRGLAACAATENGWLLTGITDGFLPQNTGIAIRVDSLGEVLWTRLFLQNVIGSSKTGMHAALAANGDFVISCMVQDNLPAGEYDGALVRLRPDGTVRWMRKMGGTGYDNAEAMMTTSDGGAILLGNTDSYTNQSFEAWACKLDSNGQQVWSRVYLGSGSGEIQAGTELPGGDLALVAYNSAWPGGSGTHVFRTTATGIPIWSKNLGFSLNGSSTPIQVSALGSEILVAGREFLAQSTQAWLMVLDTLGNVKRAKIRTGQTDFDARKMIPYRDSLVAFAGATNLYLTQQGNATLWVTDTTSQAFCTATPRPVVSQNYALSTDTFGNTDTIRWDSSVSLRAAFTPVRSQIVCSNQNGCTLTANFSAQPNRYIQCQFVPFQLVADSTGSPTVNWYQNGIPAGSGNSLSVQPADTGRLVIQLVVESGGCRDSVTREFWVVPPPAARVVVDGDGPLCPGSSVVLSLPGAWNQVLWQPVNVVGNPVTVTQPGTYFAQVTDTNGCEGQSNAVTINLLAAPAPAFSFSQNGAITQFTDNSSGAVSWNWDFGDGNGSSQQNPTYVYSATGTYLVCLSVLSQDGCEADTCLPVTIDSLTGLPENIQIAPAIFPNPADQQLQITGREITGIRIMDLRGQIRLSFPNRSGQSILSLPVTDLPEGYYLLEISTRTGVFHRKIWIQHP